MECPKQDEVMRKSTSPSEHALLLRRKSLIDKLVDGSVKIHRPGFFRCAVAHRTEGKFPGVFILYEE